MNLRARIFVLSCCTILLVLVLGYWVASSSIASGYRRLEETDVQSRMRSVQGALAEMLDNLAGTSKWMAVVAARDQSLLQLPELASSVLADGFLIVNPDGSVGAHSRDLDPAELAAHTGLDGPILQNSLYSSAPPEGSGIIQLAKGPFLIAWYVLPALGKTEPQPILALVQRISPDTVAQNAGLPGMSLSILSPQASENTEIVARAREAILAGKTTVVDPLDNSTILGYSLLTDIYGEPALLFRGTFPRDLFAQGLASRSQLIWSLLISGVLLSIAVFLLLYRYGLVRIERLVGEVKDIRASGDLGRRVTASSKDEIGALIDGINQMLAGLEAAHLTQVRSEQRHRVVIEQMTEGVAIIDPTGKIIDINPALEHMLGYEPGQRVGDSVFAHLALSEARAQEAIQWIASTGDPFRGQIALLDATGQAIEFEVSLTRVDWGGQGALCASVHDIRERAHFEAELRHRAYHDVLTGLPNRFLLTTRLDQAIAEAGQTGEIFALMFIDLNHFKDINDTWGHAAGDELLGEIARRLASVVRGEDTVARMGGDEFCLILRGIGDPRRAAAIAERLVSVIGEPVWLESGLECYPSASVGIALFPRDGLTADELLRRSDQAMYQAKSSSVNSQALFYSGNIAKSRSGQEITLAKDLPGALERREMLLHYQPIIELATRKLVAVEAMLRWNHPEYGLLTPNEFLYLIEDNSTVGVLGEWALREAVRQNRSWQAMGYPAVRVAFSISPWQSRWSGFTEAVGRILDQIGMASKYLELAMAETTLSQATEIRLREIRALRRRGVKVVLEEFGSGFTGLASLADLPIDGVKLSWELIVSGNLEASPDDFGEGILALIARRTEELGFYSVTVGIETEDQYLAACRSGCKEGQGYLWGGPVPAPILEHLVRVGTIS